MSDPTAPLQAAIDALLRASPELKAAMGGTTRLYDVPPTNAPLPYVTIGDASVLPDVGDGYDGTEVEANLHVWAKERPQAKAISAVVQGILVPVGPDGWHAPPAMDIPGFRLTDTSARRASHLIDPGPELVAHSVVTIAFLVEPA